MNGLSPYQGVLKIRLQQQGVLISSLDGTSRPALPCIVLFTLGLSIESANNLKTVALVKYNLLLACLESVFS